LFTFTIGPRIIALALRPCAQRRILRHHSILLILPRASIAVRCHAACRRQLTRSFPSSFLFTSPRLIILVIPHLCSVYIKPCVWPHQDQATAVPFFSSFYSCAFSRLPGTRRSACLSCHASFLGSHSKSCSTLIFCPADCSCLANSPTSARQPRQLLPLQQPPTLVMICHHRRFSSPSVKHSTPTASLPSFHHHALCVLIYTGTRPLFSFENYSHWIDYIVRYLPSSFGRSSVSRRAVPSIEGLIIIPAPLG
jgi:hypothetical protein